VVVSSITVVSVTVAALAADSLHRRNHPSAADINQPSLVRNIPAARAPDSIVLEPIAPPPEDIELIAEARPARDAVILADARGRVSMIVAEGDTIRAGGVVARLEIARTASPVVAPDAQLRRAEADLAQKRRALERSERLLAEGGISRREHEMVRSAAEGAERAMAALRDATPAPVAAREANVIRAPFDALILEVSARRGSSVSPGAPLLRLADISVMEVAAVVGESDALRIAAGDSVAIAFDDLSGETFVTTIEKVDRRMSEGGNAAEVIALVPDPNLRLRAGMVGKMTIRR
jgi:RND family efflux transporter MFP subunit